MQQYSPQERRYERVIAAARVILAIAALLVIWLDPDQPARHEGVTYAALCGYIVYALALSLSIWRTPIVSPVVRIMTLAGDFIIFAGLIVLTENPTGPFSLYYTFFLICAAFRWQWRGILWAAPAALLALLGTGMYRIHGLHDANMELNPSIMGITYVALIASLLGSIEARRQRVNNNLSKLAARPSVISDKPDVFIRNALASAADVFQAPRVLMVWEDREEPYTYVAVWSHHKFSWTREPPTTYNYLVAETLANTSFLCADAHMLGPKVLYLSSGALHRWHGIPLHPHLQKHFAVGAVLSSRLRGEIFEGRLFFLDKIGFTRDDLVLGEIVARQVAADLEQFHLMQRWQQAAITKERARLVRNLHDGLLQSLTGMALQLEETRRLLKDDPPAAHEHLLEMQHLLADEQRDLRFLVSGLQSTSLSAVEGHRNLATRLEVARRRIQCQWGLRVELTMTPPESPIPAMLTSEIYYIIREALANAARHAHASAVRAELSVWNDHVRITVTDNGRGFSFYGHYSLAMLTHQSLGPVMLRDRIASLGGSLALESTPAGARLEIRLPFSPPGRQDTHMLSLDGGPSSLLFG
jgi:signal transduction histidine kinase